MAQLNLLPDVKLEFLKTSRNKRLVFSVSIIIIIASVAITLLLVSIAYIFQKKNLSDLNGDITTYNEQLQNTPSLSKILTIQNQLNTLTGLHENKAVAARLFNYLPQITPSTASITQLDVDFTANSMTITGTAPTLDVANTYTDTLKFTTYHQVNSTDASQAQKAFSDVVLSQFVRNNSGATFTITSTFDPAIFNSANAIGLTVPKIISTRSSTEQPTDLFQNAPATTPSTTTTTKGAQ
jgi:Tfp pilus assembly protein PilN